MNGATRTAIGRRLPWGWAVRALAAVLGVVGMLVLTACASAPSTAPERTATARPGPPPGDAGLLAQVRGGGVIIVFRHAATDRSQPDADERTGPDAGPVDFDDCSTQRNLSDEGRADARAIGEAFRALRIPVGMVWTSPYCRSQDTAELAFGRAEVIDDLERLYPRRDQVAERRLNQLIREQAPGPGEPNLVISGHGVYPSVLQPAVALAEGEAALYTLRGDAVVLLGQVTPEEWAGLGARDAGNLSGIAGQILPSVVAVETRQGDRSTTGSGFRVAVPGIVVTNAHLVRGADEVSVIVPDGSRRTARVLGSAQDYDIAVLEVDDSGLPPLHSGSGLAGARIGDPVFAVGHPHGRAGAVTSGTLRALNQPVRLGDGGAELEAVQTDARIAPESSGGPLVNARGEVLGVLTVIAMPPGAADSTGSTFAIPVDVARHETLNIVRNA